MGSEREEKEISMKSKRQSAPTPKQLMSRIYRKQLALEKTLREASGGFLDVFIYLKMHRGVIADSQYERLETDADQLLNFKGIANRLLKESEILMEMARHLHPSRSL
jgi:hypothetical protein